MASIVFPLGWRLTDANGKPVNNGKIRVYDAGTTNPSSVYSDKALSTALTQPIRTNSGGIPVTSGNAETLIYVATSADYKVEAKTSDDAQLWGPIDDYTVIGRSSGVLGVPEGGTGGSTEATARTGIGAAAASDVSSLTSTVTTIDGDRSALPGGSFGDVAGLDVVTPEYLDGLAELCVKTHYDDSPSSTSITATTIGIDATVPQNTEGTEIFSHAYTPLYATSVLEIEADVAFDISGAQIGVVAVFQSGSASAIMAKSGWGDNATASETGIRIVARFSPGSTSAVTISVRAGVSGGTMTINPYFGAAGKSWFRIRELMVPPLALS